MYDVKVYGEGEEGLERIEALLTLKRLTSKETDVMVNILRRRGVVCKPLKYEHGNLVWCGVKE